MNRPLDEPAKAAPYDPSAIGYAALARIKHQRNSSPIIHREFGGAGGKIGGGLGDRRSGENGN